MPVLELKNVCCGYGKTDIIKNVSLELEAGEILSLAGPNGCGKTTLLRAACGLLPIRAGEVLIKGKSAASFAPKERAKLTAMLSQTGEGGEYSDYTVMETVLMGRYARMGGKLFAETSEEDIKAAENAIAELELSDLKDRYITELSGGQLRRVFLARAFAQEPEILFLDEPANHLDPKHQTELCRLLQKWKDSGRSAVGVFHDIGYAAAVSDRIMLMQDGKAVLCDEPEKIIGSGKLNDVFETDIAAHMKNMARFWIN